MKNCKAILFVMLALLATSCCKKAAIEGTLPDAPKSQVIVKLLNTNTFDILDTIKTNEKGEYSYKLKVTEGQPEFVYVFYKENKIASALLNCGETVKFVSDTLGHYTVEGNEESILLQQVEQKYTAFSNELLAAVDEYNRQKMTKIYVTYYRDCVKYVMTHSHSLTVVPVLFQNLDAYSPIFSQETDAIHFRNVLDTLKTVYPDSKYVKALETETIRRENIMKVNSQLRAANEAPFPDIEMSDVNGKKVKLSDVKSKAILVHFWTASDPTHKMFNTQILKPIYDDYSKRGLQIFSVCIDTNKADWATTVKAQNLPWINVCDGLGGASPAMKSYNVQELPASFMIVSGNLGSLNIMGETGLRKELERLLK